MSVSAIVLAAGKGKRMKSSLPKVLHPILGRPVLSYVLDSLKGTSPDRTLVVIGQGSGEIQKVVNSGHVEYVIQSEQLGTGDAVLSARGVLKGFNGTVLILNGDSPLVRPETLKGFIKSHSKGGFSLSILTANLEDPKGYGRVIRNSRGEVWKIVEEKEAIPKERVINEINSGIYCVESRLLWKVLERVGRNNNQREIYLTDIVYLSSSAGERVNGFLIKDAEEVLGINNRVELSAAEGIIRKRVNDHMMLSGVTIVNKVDTFISPGVSIGHDTVIYPNTYIFGDTRVGKGCIIGPSVWIEDSKIGEGVIVNFSSFISKSVIEDDAKVGPFAHIRPGSTIFKGARIGNFVEIKKASIGKGSKVPHLTYVGDASIGQRVNIGAGTITCNYDGFNKHETVIENDVFIGSDTMLVAPLKIGQGATTGAGSTITKDVPPFSLAIERSKQVSIRNWKRKPRDKRKL